MAEDTHPNANPLLRLRCMTKTYEWGNRDPDSLIRVLAREGMHQVPQTGEPVAELWMGDHPGGPSQIQEELFLPAGASDSGELNLRQLIEQSPDFMLGQERGPSPGDHPDNPGLPFLFKILDASQPLSIQAHPDRTLATGLHARDPEHYPDANHKPEMVIALEGVQAMAGFRSLAEVQAYCHESKTLEALLYGSPPTERGIRSLFSSLMRASARSIGEATQKRLEEIERVHSEGPVDPADRLFVHLQEVYGAEDPGIFCPYLLNVVEPGPLEALFLAANEPHAYLRGTMIECMAASDNVVRAGLTGKYRDVETLLHMLTYEQGPYPIYSARKQGVLHSYPILTPEFQIHRFEATSEPISLPVDVSYPGILLNLGAPARITLAYRESAGQEKSKTDIREIPTGGVYYLAGSLPDLVAEMVIVSTGSSHFFLATIGNPANAFPHEQAPR